ncbi:MAG: bifunctional demethylmenaquinone methyltransferase/2-methoxy-6-polyprenyl-1,4-benzoquinol methylase UbiE [Chitinophagaceae bacterium]|uniref:bifunctional demethylmenaquinone methyltransferase/2-methoxy-6-polyprenyl-1,4-benzoquinol methylase UbiE n=1 Tax=Parasegetibacter sp. NRK P23 TaxID=2942999 RepID=UPI002042FDEE|nr:bifunctional demethylmenaquinone methyltransferase/2-methoxy-6-polyprenyl-1,4-benzoquinol methylase UbiE [Parasegetibacter sp. NRK P23]MCM5528056.1 bifunctional demethylmenaquinone methyltransferase/2-methoxy-6-polyprenyl-1,4-benzoquinol methylase UbiE [Parasegetibacter sp. NRK P23]
MQNKLPHDEIVPFKDSESTKKKQVAEMFNQIAFRYDFLNRFLSMGIDKGWRRKAIRLLKPLQPKRVLDVATGTGDVAILTWKMLKPTEIIGIDISEGMLDFGRKKLKTKGLEKYIRLESGDSETINHPDNSFDAVTVAFGVRNFEDLEKGLREMNRVLRPGGQLIVLEFSKPKTGGFRNLYNFYMGLVAPQFGKLFSKSREAYQYLNDSVKAFPEGPDFITILNKTGYCDTAMKPLSLGICTIYSGKKPSTPVSS